MEIMLCGIRQESGFADACYYGLLTKFCHHNSVLSTERSYLDIQLSWRCAAEAEVIKTKTIAGHCIEVRWTIYTAFVFGNNAARWTDISSNVLVRQSPHFFRVWALRGAEGSVGTYQGSMWLAWASNKSDICLIWAVGLRWKIRDGRRYINLEKYIIRLSVQKKTARLNTHISAFIVCAIDSLISPSSSDLLIHP